MQLDKTDLFPTRLWSARPEVLQAHVPAWITHLNDLRTSDPEPAGRSTRGGWNTRTDLLQQPVFKLLHDVIAEATSAALREQQPRRDTRFVLSGWANIHDHGGHNTLHLHPRSLLSGCFYLQVPPQAGALVFRDPRPGVLLDHFEGDGLHAQPFVCIRPESGQLLLFPHWLEHRVDPNQDVSPRISIAFNAVSAP